MKPTKRGLIVIPWDSFLKGQPDGPPECVRMHEGVYKGRLFRIDAFVKDGVRVRERTRDNN